MRIDDLEDGQEVLARWGRAGQEGPNWGKWQKVRLYVQRHQGKVTCVSLVNVNWAEGGPEDLSRLEGGNAYFVVEDYYLEIEGLES